MFKFKCSSCEETHEGVPTFGWDFPLYYLDIPGEQRDRRCELTSDTCIVDNEFFFVRGCIEIPVHSEEEPFIWGVWVSLSEKNFNRFRDLLHVARRDDEPAYFGWLSAAIKVYPDTENLKTRVHLRNSGTRPYIELEPTDHPLSLEQRNGITKDRLIEIYEAMIH